MKLNVSNFCVFLLAVSFLFCPRDIPFEGLHSYRLVLILILFLNVKKIRFNKSLFGFFTILYFMYTAGAYLLGSGMFSFLGFIIDTFFLMLSIYVTIDSKEKLVLFAKYICIAAIVYSLLCVFESFTGFNVFRSVEYLSKSKMRYGLHRSFGVASNSINNGLILVMLNGLLLFFKLEKYVNKKMITISIFLSFVACLLTLSRTPLIGLVILYLFVFFEQGGFIFLLKNLLKVFSFATLIVLVFVFSVSVRTLAFNYFNMFYAIFDGQTADNISGSFGSNANGVGERLELYKWVYDDVGDKRMFGLGANAEFAHDFQLTTKTIRTKTSIENQYLKVFYYFGYVGLAIFLLFLLNCIFVSLRGLKKHRIYRYSFFSTVILCVCWFFVSSVDDFRWLLLFISFLYIIPKFTFDERMIVKC